MRIFASDVSALLAAGGDEHLLVRRLLAYAVREVWGSELPAMEKDEGGKPHFPGEEAMHFSLSHSKGHVLVAVSEEPVGADIETLRELRPGRERLFSPGMLEDFGYFGGWTLREAVFKLVGRGSLRSMDIRRGADGIVTPFEGVRCAVYELPGCVAAAACFGGELPGAVELVDCGNFCGGA